jgi:hypothetical protein
MSSQTFKAQMAVGSWSTTPLFPGLSDVVKIVEKKMARGQSSSAESSGNEGENDLTELDTE